MALVTLHRSPSGSGRSTPVADKDEESFRRSRFQRRHSFVMVKGAALLLQDEGEESPDGTPVHSPLQKTHKRNKSSGDQDQLQRGHLQAMVDLLRPEDSIKLVVRLESVKAHRIRYLLVVSKMGCEGEDETILLGVDFPSEGSNRCTIGMVLPVWSNTQVFLDGDGGFSVTSDGMTRIFKPISVQTMWSMMQVLHKACESAFDNNHFPASSALGWVQDYQSAVASEQSCINEWMAMSDLLSVRPDSPTRFTDQPSEREIAEHTVRAKLREVMMTTDLETITSKEIRNELERRMNCNLKEYKEFIDNEMLLILAQMDRPSRIFDYLYLGSEWNASNLEELQKNGVSHILNVTREIDNFFPESLKYLNVRVYDEETTDLLQHWKETYRFISNARKQNTRVLVHCKMGVSRSGSTVIAYAMKEYGWSLEEALRYVKEKRPIVSPNPGFMRQLLIYQGILDASKQRHSDLWELKAKRDQSNLQARKKTSEAVDGPVPLETNEQQSPIDEEGEDSETEESEEEGEVEDKDEEEEEDRLPKTPSCCFCPLEGLEAELDFLAVASPESQAGELPQESLEVTDHPTSFVHEMTEETGDAGSASDDSMADEVRTPLRGLQSESMPFVTPSMEVPESTLTPHRQRINLWSVMRSISKMETLDQESPSESSPENGNSKHEEEVFISSTNETPPEVQPPRTDMHTKKREGLPQATAAKSRVKKRLNKQQRALIDKEACAHPHRPNSAARALARHKLADKKMLKQVSYQPQSGKVRKQARVLDQRRPDPHGLEAEDWQDIGEDEAASKGATSTSRPCLKHLQSVAELKKAALVSRQTKAFERSQRPQQPLSPEGPNEVSKGPESWDTPFEHQEEMVLSPTALPETLMGASGFADTGLATTVNSRDTRPPTQRLERATSGPKKMVRWENVEGDEPPATINAAEAHKVSHENGAT